MRNSQRATAVISSLRLANLDDKLKHVGQYREPAKRDRILRSFRARWTQLSRTTTRRAALSSKPCSCYGRQCSAPPTWQHSVCGRAPEAENVAIGVLDIKVLRAPRSLRKWFDDPCAGCCAIIEGFDALNTSRGISMLVRTPMSAPVVVLGRFLQVKLNPSS